MASSQQNIPTTQKVIAVLWPSFLTAGIATILFFTAFDPELLMQTGGYGPVTRIGGYTVGFFLFWLLTASTGVLTCYFQRPCHEPTQSEFN
ncbi:MAG: hypothetical protein OEY78_01560 [Gammaproteobacteria bacterium]|nr:hypothetical protein [Gammaproteobacteria bacterium]